MDGVSFGTIPGVGVMPGVVMGFAGFKDGEIFGFDGTVTPGVVLDGDCCDGFGNAGVGEIPGFAVVV